MSRASTLILLGILVVLAPFSALPIAFRTFLAVILGASVSGIGFAMRAQEAREARSRAEASQASTAATASEPVATAEVKPQEPHGVSPV